MGSWGVRLGHGGSIRICVFYCIPQGSQYVEALSMMGGFRLGLGVQVGFFGAAGFKLLTVTHPCRVSDSSIVVSYVFSFFFLLFNARNPVTVHLRHV